MLRKIGLAAGVAAMTLLQGCLATSAVGAAADATVAVGKAAAKTTVAVGKAVIP